MAMSEQKATIEQGPTGGQVVALLAEQRDLYQQLRQLADKQRSMITGNEPERLLTILGERQRLIDKLQAVSQRLKPYQANWRQIRQDMNDELGGQADRLVVEVNNLLSSILQQDEADTALLSARKSQTGTQIQAVQTGRQASRAYNACSSGGGAGSGAEWT